MRFPIVGCLLVACSTFSQPPRALPMADWTKGASVFVHWKGGSERNEWRSSIEQAVDSDLRSAGMRIASEAASDTLDLTIGVGDDTATVTAARDGERLDDFSFKYDFLYCIGNSANPACIAREMVSRALESPRIASSMQHAGHAPVPAVAGARQLTGKLAVLDLRNFTKELSKENAQYFTDIVRSAALKAQPQLQIMTRENLIVLLQASGKSLDECEGECEVDTGRRIGADLIVSGELQKLGTSYKLSLRLHDTREGRLLGSQVASGKSIDDLDAAAQKSAEDLLR